MARYLKQGMSLDQCAARMTALLARDPRERKTRDYIKSLGPRGKVVVTASDFAKRVARGSSRSPSAAPKERKDRRRPAATAGPMIDRLSEATAGHCGICGQRNELWEMDVDHVVPRAAGGVNARNRVPAHRFCNRKKADRMPTGCELVWLDVVNTRLYA